MTSAKKLVDGLMLSSRAGTSFAKLTDAELADMVEEHLWAHESMLTARSSLLEEVIERLRRTGR